MTKTKKKRNTQSNFNEDLDISSIDDIFTQSQILKPAKQNDVEVEMVEDVIEQSKPFHGKREILSKLTGYQQFGPSWVLQEEYTDMFDKITVNMLKTILHSYGTGDVFNRRMSTVDYANYDADDVFYTDG